MRKTNRVLSLILAVAMVIGLVPMMTISSSAAFNDTTLKFDENGDFTILQFTDIQDDAEVEALTLATITKALDRYEPDLIVFTGDNIAGKMNEADFKSSVDQFLAPIINKGVRYAVTFGNHDQEKSTLVSTPSNDTQYNYYVSKSDLAVDFDEDSLNGTGTGAIPIYSYDERYVQFCVFPFDSGDYNANGDYDNVEADQIAWYQSEAQRLAGLSADGKPVPTLAFQHIPVPEIYDKLLVQTNSSTPGAIRGTGQWSSNYYILDPNNSSITGSMREGPCPSAINGGQYEGMLSVGNCVGLFYGHDHTNDFVGTDDNGFTQGYARALTMNSYYLEADPCAFRVFNVKPDGSYTTKDVSYADMQEEDDREYEHDIIAGTPTVPEKIFVGAEGNGIGQQKLGNVIQLQSLNYRSQAMYNNDLNVSIDLENTVTDVALSVTSGVEISGPTVTAKDGTTNTYTWIITGGTASAGTNIEYKITYGNSDGETRTQYAYSYVDDIPTPAGYYVFTRNYRSNNRESNFNTQTYVMTVVGSNVYGDTRATSDSDFVSQYDGENIGNWTNAPVGYYNYHASEDAGFQSMGNTDYGLSYFSPSRVRAHYDFPRFMEAGKSPVATIYADTSEVSTLNEMDIIVNYWRHMAPNNGITTTMQLHFKNGDSSYTKDNLAENTAGATTIYSNQTNVTLANAAGSNASFKINGTIPASGTEYTMISHGYSFWDNGYATDHNTYLPVLLHFEVYNKADIRTLVNAERTAMRQTDDIAYRNAFANAYKVLQKTNTTQSEIDGAVLVLNSAIDALTFTGDNISDNSQYAGDVTVAPVIYVAGDNYGIAQQPTGNTIVPGVLNYATGTLNTAYSKFTFMVPQGATNASVKTTTSSGGTVNHTWEADTGIGYITGGTAYEGDYITYEFTYTIGDKTYTQYEASAVLNAPQASGWLTLIKRNNRFNGTIRSIVETSVIFADVGTLPAGGYYTGKDIYSGTNYGVNLDPNSNNNYVGWSSQQVSGVGVNRWIYSSDRFYNDWICGDTGDPKNQKGTAAENDVWEYPSELDLGHRAGFDIIMDTSVLSNVSQLGMGIKYISLQNDTPNTDLGKLEITSNQGFFPGKVGFDVCVNNNSGTTNAFYLDPPTNNNGTANDWDYGVKSGNDLYLVRGLYSSGLPTAGDYTYWTEIKNSSGNDIFAHMMWNFNISYVDKAALRNVVAAEDEMYRQLSDGYSDANGKWTAYVKALLKAKATVYNVKENDAATADVQTELTTAIAALEYLPADYTEVRAKIDEVRIQHADNSYSYRPNKNMDPTYYATGNYYPWYNFQSTNEVDIPIDNINWNYDIRYQSQVDAYVDAIDIGWYNVTLANANYAVVDRYLGYKTGIGENGAAGGSAIKLPPKYDYLMNLEYIDANLFTPASYQAWTDACAAGMANRTLKAPDQPEVDQYAANLEATYNALELVGADYTELDILIAEIQQNINETVEVVDPANSANNYPIPYYSPAYIATLEAKIDEYNANLNVLEQEEVDQLVAELDELYARLGENLNDADYTFAYAQQAEKATYEDEYEKYYTADSWKALADARAAIKKGKLAGEQSVVNGYAKAIYDARNNLKYNGADYSVVAEYQAKYEELLPTKDWYVNWSAFETAYNAVVEGKDVTEQSTVDGYAAALKTAYEALEKKLADYTSLKAMIATAEAKIENQMLYTEDSYNVFYAEYLEAKEFNAKDPLTIDLQETVNSYTAELETAIKGLQWKDADISPITAALDSYYEVTGNYDFASEYPTDTDEDGIVDILEAVTAAAEAGEALVAQNDEGKLDIRNNSEIVNAANLLNTEIAKLPALYSMVNDAIAEIPEEEIAAGVYTDESVANLRAAVAAVDRNLKIGDQETVDNYAFAIWEAIDLLEEKPVVAVEFNPINGTIFDEERGFIYGLAEDGLTVITDLVAQGYIEVIGNGHVEATPAEGNNVLGTGAEVKFINDNTGEVVATYYIVIFGDYNGDAEFDGRDVKDLIDWMNWEEVKYDFEKLEYPQVFALDINADGSVDGRDIFFITEYLNWNLDFIKQTYQGQN